MDVDVYRHNYLGLSDKYEDEEVCNLNLFAPKGDESGYFEWSRYSALDDGHIYSKKLKQRMEEKGLGYSVRPNNLKQY